MDKMYHNFVTKASIFLSKKYQVKKRAKLIDYSLFFAIVGASVEIFLHKGRQQNGNGSY